MKQTKSTSPIKDKPLRNPGQSLDESIQILIDDEIVPHAATSVFIVILCLLEWFRWYKDLPYTPILYTFLAGSFVLYSYFKIRKFRMKMQKLKQGRDGERVVGQYLEQLRMMGCRVFHDIIGDNFNLDHVIISERGIFVIETKTYSKPEGQRPTIKYDGKTIRVNDYDTGTKLIEQSRAQVSWLKTVLKDSTGKEFPVQPVIVFPGWFVEANNHRSGSEPWVINPKGIGSFINNSTVVLTEDEMMMASYHLSRFIRTN